MKNSTFSKKPPQIYEKVRSHPAVRRRLFRITFCSRSIGMQFLLPLGHCSPQPPEKRKTPKDFTNRPVVGLAAGGRPSTWSPPRRLVEHNSTQNDLLNNAESFQIHF